MGGLYNDETTAPEDVNKWTVEDVCNFVGGLSGCGEYARVFREQGIDGETLPLLTEEHLLNTMGLKLGPALKIRAQVSVLINLERAEGFFVTGDGLPVPFIWQVLTQLHLFVGSQAPGPCLLHGQFPCSPSVAVNKPASP